MGDSIRLKDILRGGGDPDNPYSHQIRLIKNTKEDVKQFSDILHEHIMLGNFGDERILSLYQEEADIITDMFGFVQTHPEFKPIFDKWYWSFISRVDFTRSFKALERLLQALLKMPKLQEATGFGGMLQKLRGKKKSPEDILMEMMLYDQGGIYE